MHGFCVTGGWQKQGICTEGHGVYTHTPGRKKTTSQQCLYNIQKLNESKLQNMVIYCLLKFSGDKTPLI